MAGGLGTALWVIVAATMSGRGFGGANEGYYLLSYSHWDTTPRTFSMSQYIYGPVLEVLGGDVQKLRLFRLATLLLAHAVFAWQFMSWLSLVRLPSPIPLLNRVAGTLTITASGGIVYGWLPQTPGYNDLTVIGGMCLLTCYLRMLVRQASGRAVGVPSTVSFGVISAVMIMGRVTAAACVLTVAVAYLTAVRTWPRRAFAVLYMASGVGLVALAEETVKPLHDSVPPFVRTLKVVGENAHRPTALVLDYASSVAVSATLAIASFVLPGAVLMTVLYLRGGIVRRSAPFVGLGANLLLVLLAGGFRGGLQHVGAYQAAIVAMVISGLVAGAAAGAFRRDRHVVLLALLVPLLAACGTNNPLLAVASGGAAMWVAVLVSVVASTSHRRDVIASVARLATAATVVICLTVALSGVTHLADGTSLMSGRLRRVPDVPALASVVLPQSTLARIEALRRLLAPYVEPPGRPMIAFGELADDVYVLNGTPVGNAWFSALDDGLQAADLSAACSDGNRWGARQPIILMERSLTPREIAAFGRCSIDVDADYLRIGLGGADRRLSVLVPRADVAVPTGQTTR